MKYSKLWTKDFIIISATTFFVFLTFYLLMTTLAVYAIEEFQASESGAGLAASIFIIGTLISRVFAGKYVERIGRKRMLFGGLLLFLIAVLLYFTVNHLNLLLLVRFIHGAAFGLCNTAMATAIMSIIPSERRGEGTSYYSLSITVATATGPFLGLFISQNASYTMIFVACTLFSVISIFISLFAHIPEVQMRAEQLAELKSFKLKDFVERKAIPISLIIAIMSFAYSSILSFLPSYAKEIDLMKAASFFFIVYAIFIFISRPFTGRLLDKRGANIVIYPALVFYGIGLVILSQAYHGFAFWFAGIFIALGFGTLTSCCQAIAVQVSPPHRVGLATSTFFICMDLGMGLGPFILGSVLSSLGFRGMYLALAIFVFLCILLYYILHGKEEAKKEFAKVS